MHAAFRWRLRGRRACKTHIVSKAIAAGYDAGVALKRRIVRISSSRAERRGLAAPITMFSQMQIAAPSGDAGARNLHAALVERRLARFRPELQPRVRALAAQHP